MRRKREGAREGAREGTREHNFEGGLAGTQDVQVWGHRVLHNRRNPMATGTRILAN